MSKRVIVMSGVSGSGKSTHAINLVDALPNSLTGVVVSADDFFIGPNGYAFDVLKLGHAHARCFRLFIDAMYYQEHNLIVVDNTNTTPEEIAPYMLGAAAYEYEAEIITINAGTLQTGTKDLNMCWNRNKHNVSMGIILAQAERIANRRLPPWWKETVINVGDVKSI